MLRTLALASVASLLVLTVGCSGSPDGSSDSTDLAISAKTDAYFVGMGPGVTGGVGVRLANATSTACVNGKKQSVCAVLGVDLGTLHLDSATESSVADAFAAGHAVVIGHIDPKSATLVAKQVWLGAGTALRTSTSSTPSASTSRARCAYRARTAAAPATTKSRST
jgi:hypothetical protein